MYSITPEQVLERVADTYGVTPEAIQGRSRKIPIPEARHAATYIFVNMMGMTHERAAALTGRSDPSSATHSMREARNSLYITRQGGDRLEALIDEMYGEIA